MIGIQNLFKSPLFCFHGNCGQVCQTDSDFFGVSRSTRCGCCSYQVSSISVWRVICYDRFCVMAAILKKINPYQHNFTWHIIFLQGFIKFDQGISEKSSGQNVWKNNNNNNNNSEKET